MLIKVLESLAYEERLKEVRSLLLKNRSLRGPGHSIPRL